MSTSDSPVPTRWSLAVAVAAGGVLAVGVLVSALVLTAPDLRESAREEITEVVRIPFVSGAIVDALEERGVFEEAEQELATTFRGAIAWALGAVLLAAGGVAALARPAAGRCRRQG